MNPTLKRYGACGLFFLVGLLAGVALDQLVKGGQPVDDRQGQISPGSEILSILGDEVMFLGYRSASLTLTAQRARPGDRFALQVSHADGGPAEQCLVSPDLAGLLPAFSTLVAGREIEAARLTSEFPQKLGSLEIRDRIDNEPPPPMNFFTSAGRTAVALAGDGYRVEVAIPVAAFDKLAGGCKTLAR